MQHPLKLVIAEDDQQIAEIQKRFIERIGNIELCGIAHSIADAEDLIDVFKPDLLLLDVQFPEGTGIELLNHIRAENQATDVILITAAKDVNTLKTALRSGVFDYILKPLVFERLEETILKYRIHIEKLESIDHIAQREVDNLMPRFNTSSEPTAEPFRLPKGIDSLTLDRIRTVMQACSKGVNAEHVGQLIGASRTTARRYLEYLVSTTEIYAEVEYGTVGRPERKYHI